MWVHGKEWVSLHVRLSLVCSVVRSCQTGNISCEQWLCVHWYVNVRFTSDIVIHCTIRFHSFKTPYIEYTKEHSTHFVIDIEALHMLGWLSPLRLGHY